MFLILAPGVSRICSFCSRRSRLSRFLRLSRPGWRGRSRGRGVRRCLARLRRTTRNTEHPDEKKGDKEMTHRRQLVPAPFVSQGALPRKRQGGVASVAQARMGTKGPHAPDQIFSSVAAPPVVKSAQKFRLPRRRRSVMQPLLGSRLSLWRFCMEDRASVSQSATTTRRHEGRGAWVLTCYGICGLALFGILAYFISEFLSH